MANRTGKIWLSKNIKLDKDYRSVLNYSETQLITLMENNSNLVYYSNSYSFMRDTGEIIVKATYGTCIQANYMAFQNVDYSNKIFFAFIDEVEYVGEQQTKIRYTIDVWSTWYSYWTAKACFVVREHVTDDTVGKHTVPENVETGDYISCDLQPTRDSNPDKCYVVACTEQVTQQYGSITLGKELPDAMFYYGFTTLQGVRDFIKIQDTDHPGVVNSVFVAYKDMFGSWSTMADVDGQISAEVNYSYNRLFTITRVNYLGEQYIPVNNKLLTYPFSFLQVSNNAGQIVNYHYENWGLIQEGGSDIQFSIYGTISPGCSIRVFPVNYNNILNDFDDGINVGKLPVGSFTTDTFTNWLTQNGVNVGLQAVSDIYSITQLNPSGAFGIANNMASVYQHYMMPNQVHGNVNCGDVNFVYGLEDLRFKRMSIKNEYAAIIDKYFTLQGYKVNSVKVPNMSHRQNYNYVQVADGENVAYVNNHNNICPPSKDIDTINRLFRRGITIWNNHSNLGDYSVSNNITT